MSIDPESLPLAIFAKRPAPGQVKTRLVPPLSMEGAADLALAMLDDRMQSLSEARLILAPARAVDWARARYPDRRVEAQRGEHLGQRMEAWFQEVGAGLVVGADSPGLGQSLVQQARRRLAAGADAVFAPDQGGGYALVGLARPAPELFTSPCMSSGDNLQHTLDRANELGLAVELLPTQLDIDTEPDMTALLRELHTRRAQGRERDFPHRTLAVLLALQTESAT